ncbi:TPA: helix-turn-helix transcriptional regulator [Clostridioides difficile]|nr:helix-turn-helix transcriptional regulator [Clostridioides difficile]HDJ1470914.1 helix-turn-helix transcriptional regulator [Clostridioides difficile]HEK4907875.1 helix-turn-helix transcriptional regulator [Clostridioides difficile]
MEFLGTRIRERRKELGLTIEQLSEKIDIGYNHLSNIERGKKVPSLSTFLELINALDISADIILRDSVENVKPHVLNKITNKLEDLNPDQLRTVEEVLTVLIKNLKYLENKD